MATRSLILKATKLTNDKIKLNGIYCHFDGYVVNGVGETLAKHYKYAHQVDELIALGNIEALHNTIEETEKRRLGDKLNLNAYKADVPTAKDGSCLFDGWYEVKEFIANVLVDVFIEYVYIYFYNLADKWQVLQHRFDKEAGEFYGDKRDFKAVRDILNKEWHNEI